ncbi:MAG: hypothetical protein MJ154_03305 [Candidatus Saccharibacteria bacterium]|nr:hypothetical protein [Candidatus Saccharibacteria bacterium]
MKIVEKKCPNCGANLDFKVGESDVTCSGCRRKFAVEYDHTNFESLSHEAVEKLNELNVQLMPVHKIVSTMSIVIFAIVFVTIAISMIMFTINFTKTSNSINETIDNSRSVINR